VLEYGFERVYYLENVASNVRVTPRMFERLHRALGWGCKILGIEEPELFVQVDPVPNAFTYGHTRPFIVLSSGLVDMLDDEERFFVIAHELGHIKCGHVLYTVLARNIAAVVSLIGQATLGLGALLGQGLVLALHDWYRKSELSADRAGLLCVQDINPATAPS
jgi:Zn-dependent protease with chaperone function